MKRISFVSVLAGAAMLVASLAPVKVSALSVASMTMDGAYSTDGHFSIIVYENTGTDTVTGAAVALTFNQPVTNVSYDYNVGPFKAVDFSGAHNAYGTVTGRNALARVNFTLASPGTVIADVSASGSYLWHVEGATIEDFAFEKGQAYFTYTPPAPKEEPEAPVKTAAPKAAAPAATPAPVDTPAALGAETTKDSKAKVAATDTTKQVKNSNAGILTSSLSALAILAAAVYWLIARRRPELMPFKAYKLGAPTAASKSKPATNRSKATKKRGKE